MSKKKALNAKQLQANIHEFKTAVIYFQSYFGLFQWEIHVDEKVTDNRAEVHWNAVGRITTIYYSRAWIKDPETSMEEIAKVAFHEIAELMQCEAFENLGQHRGWEFAQEQTHVVVRFLENKLFPVAYKEYLNG